MDDPCVTLIRHKQLLSPKVRDALMVSADRPTVEASDADINASAPVAVPDQRRVVGSTGDVARAVLIEVTRRQIDGA
jgi:hypothetical protein